MSVRRPPTLTDPTLATATAHPTRVHILSILNGRVDTPANIAAELEESIRHVAYHMDVLLGLRCVELVSVKTARGGRVSERFYTAIQRPLFDAASWDRLDPSQKHGVVTTIMRLVSEEVAEAMADGTFFDPDDNHLSRTPMVLDAEGWQEVITILDGALEDLLAVQERTSERLKDGDRETILAKVAMIHFRSPRRW